jgi:hypothetical protein
MIVRAPATEPWPPHIFDATSEYLDSDTVFAVKPSVVRSFDERSANDPDRPPSVEDDWVSLSTDIVLAPGDDQSELVDPGRTAERADASRGCASSRSIAIRPNRGTISTRLVVPNLPGGNISNDLLRLSVG